MGKLCCVKKCPNSTGKPTAGTVIHNFPSQQSLRDKWSMSLCGNMKSVNLDNCGVCSNHFRLSDYNITGVLNDVTNKKKRCLRTSSVPTIHLNSDYFTGNKINMSK